MLSGSCFTLRPLHLYPPAVSRPRPMRRMNACLVRLAPDDGSLDAGWCGLNLNKRQMSSFLYTPPPPHLVLTTLLGCRLVFLLELLP